MANLIRSAKSASDWTRSDLEAYNISVRVEDAATFFGIPELPQPHIDPEILNIENAENMIADKNVELIILLDMVMVPTAPEESSVDDFAVELFKALGYVRRNRVARTRKDLPLLVCGEQRHAETDVCIIDHSRSILLLVQEDKRFGVDVDAEAQLIAEALGAFSLNNFHRKQRNLPEQASEIIPGIVMFGTSPTFYKIPVTSELVYNVRHGTYPPQPTHVSVFNVPVPRPHRRVHEGMKPLDSRREILRCYEAFKNVVGI